MFNWNDFLRIAQDFLTQYGNGDLSNAACRSATSRAYYALFNISLEFAVNKLGYVKPAKDVHKKLILFLISQDRNEEEKKIGETLKRLRKKRNKADYEYYHTYDYREAITATVQSKNAIEVINTLN